MVALSLHSNSTSVGMTEDPVEVFGHDFPYLKSVETSCKLSPYYMWVKRIPAAIIEKALDVSGLKDIAIDSYTASNRVRTFRIITETGEVEVSGYDLRKNIGWDELPSTMITDISRDGDILYLMEKAMATELVYVSGLPLKWQKPEKVTKRYSPHFIPAQLSRSMKTADFDFDLPRRLVASRPSEKRDFSRLLILHKDGSVEHKLFFSVIDYLEEGDMLLMNNTKVFPVRIIGRRTGGQGWIFYWSGKRTVKNLGDIV